MYWYLSFLRPPPVSTPISAGSITITPQIANDLRTELLFKPTEITYAWQRIAPSLGTPVLGAETIGWCPPESTYRPTSIPLPVQAKPGESWRLGLRIGAEEIVNLQRYAQDGPGIIPVWSEGISLVRGESSSTGQVRGVGAAADGTKTKKGDQGKAKSKGKAQAGVAKVEEGKKQGRIQREWALSETEEGVADRLRIVEQTSFDLDKKIWDSGLGLSAWIWRLLETTHPVADVNVMMGVFKAQNPLKVVEIGSGTGLVSIALALALQRSQLVATKDRSISIYATDLDSAIELMDENLALNGLSSPTDDVAVRAEILDWDQALPAWVESPWPDVVIAADVTYNTASFPALHTTLISLLRPKTGKRPRLLLAYKQRDAAERELWDLLRGSGVELQKVDEIQGSEEEGEVEIWIGQARPNQTADGA